MAEDNIEKRKIPGEFLKKGLIYGLFILFGILGGTFFNTGARDSLKETANLVSQTGKEVFQGAKPGGVSFSLPINKSTKAKPTKIIPASPSINSAPPKAPEITGAANSTSSSAGVSEVSTSSVINSMASTSANNASSSSANEIVLAETPPKSEPAPIIQPSKISKLLIFEVQITGGPGNSEQDFIKIYNPTQYSVNADGWKLRKRSKTGGESSIKAIPNGTVISSGGTLTWANSKDDFAITTKADISSTITISADNSIAILDADGKIIDAVAWGEGTGQFVEGSTYPANPEAGQILRRKAGGANLQDTDNNSADFSV